MTRSPEEGASTLRSAGMVAPDSPTPMFDALVGPAALDVREKIVEALRRGNAQAGEAYDFSPHSDSFTYGTNRWRFCLAEVGSALAAIEGARQLNPRNSRMWIVGGAVCYPVHYANDTHTDVRSASIRASALRRDLFAKLGRLSRYVQLELDFDEPVLGGTADDGPIDDGPVDDLESEELDLVVEEPAGDSGLELPRMVVVAYASNRHAGLLRAYVGEAVMAENGRLYWEWVEELPITREKRRLRSVSDRSSGPTFANAPEPALDVVSGAAPDVAPEEVEDRVDDARDGEPDA